MKVDFQKLLFNFFLSFLFLSGQVPRKGFVRMQSNKSQHVATHSQLSTPLRQSAPRQAHALGNLLRRRRLRPLALDKHEQRMHRRRA